MSQVFTLKCTKDYSIVLLLTSEPTIRTPELSLDPDPDQARYTPRALWEGVPVQWKEESVTGMLKKKPTPASSTQ